MTTDSRSDRDRDRVDIRRAKVGAGLFAARAYRADQIIIRVEGRIVDAQVMTKIGGTFADNCFRFGPETYLDPGDNAGRYLNHSCEPNAGVFKTNNRLFLFAASAIERNREIVIDYSTILGDDDIWTMRCKCGARTCRKVIKNFGSLPAELQESYIRRGMVPRFIINTLEP